MFKELGPDILHYDQGYCSKSSDSLDLSELKPARTTRLICSWLLNLANYCDSIYTICLTFGRIRLEISFPIAAHAAAGYHHWLLSSPYLIPCIVSVRYPSHNLHPICSVSLGLLRFLK